MKRALLYNQIRVLSEYMRVSPAEIGASYMIHL